MRQQPGTETRVVLDTDPPDVAASPVPEHGAAGQMREERAIPGHERRRLDEYRRSPLPWSSNSASNPSSSTRSIVRVGCATGVRGPRTSASGTRCRRHPGTRRGSIPVADERGPHSWLERRECGGQWRAGRFTLQQRLHRREPLVADIRANLDVVKSSGGHERAQVLPIPGRKRRPHHRAGLTAHVSFQRLGDRAISGRVVNRSQHGDRRASPVRQDAPHFTQGCRRLREELERLLTRHRIERPVLEWQSHGVARMPRNRGEWNRPTPRAPPSTCPRSGRGRSPIREAPLAPPRAAPRYRCRTRRRARGPPVARRRGPARVPPSGRR